MAQQGVKAGDTVRVHYKGWLDGNHPLPGRTLNFEIRLEGIVASL